MWEQIRQPHNKLLIEDEKFQGVTWDGLRVFGLVNLKLEFKSQQIENPVVVVDKITLKFILGNDFLVAHQCNILNSDGTIVFGSKPVPYTLFCSAINLICPVICKAWKEIEPYEEVIISGLLDSYRSYDPNQTLLLEPPKNELMQLLVDPRVVVNFTSAVVPILVSNISSERVTIPKGKVIADDTAHKTRRVATHELSAPSNCVAVVPTTDAGSAPSVDPVANAMKNADMALVPEQRVLLERLLLKHAGAFASGPTDLGRTSLMYHRIDTGDNNPVRQPMRRVFHEHIPALKAEVDILQNANAVVPSTSPFASPTILVKKKEGSMRLCIDYRKLNAVTKKDAHPLPRFEDIFDTLTGSKFFCTLDLAMKYHQVEVHPDDREKTAFSTQFGRFQYNVMPFGLATAPATFMRLMTIVFLGMQYSK